MSAETDERFRIVVVDRLYRLMDKAVEQGPVASLCLALLLGVVGSVLVAVVALTLP